MFQTHFDSFVIDGETIECFIKPGLHAVARVERDDDASPPDERQEGFWPSLDPNDPGYIGPKSRSTLWKRTKQAKAVMEAWRNGEWGYCGVIVNIYHDGIQLTQDYAHALWGIDRNYPKGNNNHLMEVANELLPEALAAILKLKELSA